MRRLGIGEWFGRLFHTIPIEERKVLARIAKQSIKKANQPCPFRSQEGITIICNKKGGVCSFRYYDKDDANVVQPASGPDGGLITFCPARFSQDQLVHRWVGEKLINTTTPTIVTELNFLIQKGKDEIGDDETDDHKAVGRIDAVLVNQDVSPMSWCAIEMQSVYFSGPSMTTEFDSLMSMRKNDGVIISVENPSAVLPVN